MNFRFFCTGNVNERMEYDAPSRISNKQAMHLLFEGVCDFVFTVYAYQYLDVNDTSADKYAMMVAIACNIMSSFVSSTVDKNVMGTDLDNDSPQFVITVLRNSILTAMFSVSLESWVNLYMPRLEYCARGKRMDGSRCNSMDQPSTYALFAIIVSSTVLSRFASGMIDHVHVMLMDDRYTQPNF